MQERDLVKQYLVKMIPIYKAKALSKEATCKEVEKYIKRATKFKQALEQIEQEENEFESEISKSKNILKAFEN